MSPKPWPVRPAEGGDSESRRSKSDSPTLSRGHGCKPPPAARTAAVAAAAAPVYHEYSDVHNGRGRRGLGQAAGLGPRRQRPGPDSAGPD